MKVNANGNITVTRLDRGHPSAANFSLIALSAPIRFSAPEPILELCYGHPHWRAQPAKR
jgi:hypothetical protein